MVEFKMKDNKYFISETEKFIKNMRNLQIANIKLCSGGKLFIPKTGERKSMSAKELLEINN